MKRPIFVSIAVASIAVSATSQVNGQTNSSSGSASGVSTSTAAPYSCADDPERHRFDFWLGGWIVTTEDGKHVGDSIIETASNGCAILENWMGAGGGRGKSLNSYNTERKQWEQFWIGSDGDVHEYRESKSDGRSLVFFMKRDATPQRIVRLTFAPVDKDTVRQHSEVSEDGGQTWKTDYDFYYHRQK